MSAPLLRVRDLAVTLQAPGGGRRPILRDVSFDLRDGEILGVVGESGSGKSLLALTLSGLLPEGAESRGVAAIDGQDILGLAEPDMARLRGRTVAMIVQEPATALDPRMRVGDQVAEVLRIQGASRAAAQAETGRLLDRVRLANERGERQAFPHELSGGQRQRVAIAIAVAGKPRLLVADEPTTALDAVMRSDILELLTELVAERRTGLVLVSHDLAAVARVASRTLVLYAGTRLEEAPTRALLGRPLNPYARALIASTPTRRAGEAGGARRLAALNGTVPSFDEPPPGCRFAPRCPARIESCDSGEPPWELFENGARGVRCIRAGELASR